MNDLFLLTCFISLPLAMSVFTPVPVLPLCFASLMLICDHYLCRSVSLELLQVRLGEN